jgi:hypothetical protein
MFYRGVKPGKSRILGFLGTGSNDSIWTEGELIRGWRTLFQGMGLFWRHSYRYEIKMNLKEIECEGKG